MKRSLCAILALLLLLTACGQGASPSGDTSTEGLSWQEQYDLGVRYLSEGNYEEAIIAFTAAIEIDPKQAPAYVGRGDAYSGAARLAAGDVAELSEEVTALCESAVADYLTAIELDDQMAKVYLKAAEIYMALEDTDAAIEILSRGYEATGDESLQMRLDELFGVMVPENLTQGSERWTALESFLANFAWYGDYDHETVAERKVAYEGAPLRNTLEGMLTVAGCYSYNDALYPGEAMELIWGEPDPQGKWDSYIKTSAAKIEWILKCIFNCSQADIEAMKEPILTGEDEQIDYWYQIYYQNDYYYSCLGGIGGGYNVSIIKIEQRGMRYYVEYNLVEVFAEVSEPRCAEVSLKEIDGKEYWTLYYSRELKNEEMDWRGQYRKFVYNESYLQYGGPYNEGEGQGTDYYPITFSLRDISGDGIPELIVYNGSDYEAGAYYNVFTSEPTGVKYVGVAGFRIGGFSYRDNPKYPGLFYSNGNMGYYPGDYYYMDDGVIMDEWVLTEEESIVNGEVAGLVTTQVTSDDALFDEFQNGNGHALAAYTLAEIDAMGWGAFVQETGGQTWS